MKKFIVFFLLLLTSTPIFSQSNKTTAPATTQVTSTPVEDPQVSEVIKNLEAARRSEDLTAKSYWENKLHELTHPQIINSAPSGLIGRKESGTTGSMSQIINMTKITGGLVVANSISRERVTGVIYAALGISGVANPDTLKVYKSTNNGINFDYIYSISSPTLKITNNALDIEAVSKGDSTFAFVGMSYALGTDMSSIILRIRQDGVSSSTTPLIGSAARKYTNARITSDNANYTSTAYIYLSVTLDSIVSGTRHLKQKFYRVENIFNSTIALIAGYQDPSFGSYGYIVDGAAPDSAKFMTDIAYVQTAGGTSQLYTVAVVRGVPGVYGDGSSLHFTRSITYGATSPSLFFTIDPDHIKDNPRMASTGLADNSLMVLTNRLYGGGDWDPYSFYTTDITIPSPAFTTSFLDQSSDTTKGVSLTAKYRSPGVYLAGYSNKYITTTAANVYTKLFTGGLFQTSAKVNSNTLASVAFGLVDVTFRNVNGDSTLAIWAGNGGIGCYVTGGNSGASVGVQNPNTNIKDFQLNQNYPNPFNPSTKISYNLPVASNVSIKIFDVIGKEVAEIVNETQSTGLHSVEFNAATFSSGVYYYKISAGDFSDTKKMLLVK